MSAFQRNNLIVAVIFFACWFGINLCRVTVSEATPLVALILLFFAFLVASYLALRDGFLSFLWAIGWTIATLVGSAVVITCTLGLGFHHI